MMQEQSDCEVSKLAEQLKSSSVREIDDNSKSNLSSQEKYSNEVASLKKRLSDKQKALDELKDKYNSAVIKCEKAENSCSFLRNEVTKLKQEAATLAHHHPGSDICLSPNIQSDSSVHDLQCQLETVTSELHTMKTYCQKYFELVKRCDQEKQEALQKLEHTESTKNRLSCQLDEFTGKIETLKKDLEAVTNERNELRKQITNSNPCQTVIPESEIQRLKNQVSKLLEDNKIADLQIEKQKQHEREQEEKIEKLIVRCGHAENDLKRVVASCNQERYRMVLGEKEDQILMLRADKENLDKEIVRLKQELESVKSLTGSDDAFFMKEQLKAFQDDYMAERREKEQVMQDNEALRNELRSRTQMHSPPTQHQAYQYPVHPQRHYSNNTIPPPRPPSEFGHPYGNPYFTNDPHGSSHPTHTNQSVSQSPHPPRNPDQDRNSRR